MSSKTRMLSPSSQVTLPDEKDRHVLAAAVTAEATVLCTANISDFPAAVVDDLGFEVLTAGDFRVTTTISGGL
jgi:hypothetical protein